MTAAKQQGWDNGIHNWQIRLMESDKKCRAVGIISSVELCNRHRIYMCKKGVDFTAYCLEVTGKHDYRVRSNLKGRVALLLDSKHRKKEIPKIKFGDLITLTLDLESEQIFK